MITAPMSKWEGTEAYFTFANDPNILFIVFGLAVAVVVGSMIFGSAHEKECYVKIEKNGH